MHSKGHHWLTEHHIPYHITPSGMTMVEGDLRLPCRGLELLPFEDLGDWGVEGTFDCSGNRLVTLAGAPRRVGGDFLCQGNQLADLQGAPERVGGRFNCALNRLHHLGGAPRLIGGDLDCQGNLLSDLDGLASIAVAGVVDVQDNDLASVAGARHLAVVGEDAQVRAWDRACALLED